MRFVVEGMTELQIKVLKEGLERCSVHHKQMAIYAENNDMPDLRSMHNQLASIAQDMAEGVPVESILYPPKW